MPLPTTTKFCLPDDVKAHFAIEDGYDGDDTQITTHIKAATALVRKYTRRSWERATYVQHFSTRDLEISINVGNSAPEFMLNERPLVSVTSVIFNTAGDFANTDPLTEDKGYYVDLERNSIVMYPGRMTSHPRSLKVTYVAGYEADGTDAELLLVPEHMKQAVAIQAAFTWRRVLNATSGKSQKQDQKGFANYSLSSTGLVKDALAFIRSDARVLIGSHG